MGLMNPYRIEPPFSISFSGGRTSGYLLWKILEAYGGKLPEESCVIFANTGKERLETLEFVHEVETQWGVNVDWVEYQSHETTRGRCKVITYDTASRNGEPFSAMMNDKQFRPNPVARICTSIMKIALIQHRSIWHLGRSFSQVIGIRFDEPKRWNVAGPDRTLQNS